ncbi:MAG: hypothetical protein V2I27_05010 [Erythrobacter sp.]|nr:hypothetical protein [Erythrobacter sp.]
MKSTIKTWTTLGLASALMGAGLAGCAGEAGEGGEAAQEDTAAPGEMGAGEGGEGEGGEGEGGEGEGGEGEGGVAFSEAATNPIVFGSALAIVEAHAIAARDAYAAGRTEAAAEMFAHPVSEVLADMQPAFEQLGIADISPAMGAASEAALKPDNARAVNEAFEAIIAALRDASAKAPASAATEGEVAAGILADQIDRAVTMYAEAAKGEAYEPYLDGYGFYKTAAGKFERSGAAIKAEDAALHASIAQSLDLLAKAYPGALRPDALDANQGALAGSSSKVMLAL